MSIVNLPNSQPLPLVVLFIPTEKYFVPIATACQVVVGISWSCCSFLGMKIIQGEQWTFLFLFFSLHLSIPFLDVLQWICIWDFINAAKLIDHYLIDSFNTILKLIRVKDLHLPLYDNPFFEKW